jgi:hypothetical protein
MVAATALKLHGVEVTSNGMISLLNFIKIYQLVQKLMGRGESYTDRMVMSLAYVFPLGGNVG